MQKLLLHPDFTEVAAFLLAEETSNTFLLGNLLYFGIEDDNRKLRCGDYWGYYLEDRLVGVVAFFNNSQCMVHYTDPRVVAPMSRWIAENPIRLVLGSEACVRPMVPLLTGIPGRMVVRRQFFMEYQGPPVAPPVGLEFEDIRSKNNNRSMQDFVMRCMNEGFGYPISRNTAKRLLQEKTANEPYVVLFSNRRPVAQAHIQTRTPHYCQIGGVCTLPEERRHGYSRAMVQYMLGLIDRDGGRKACLVVNEDNLPARRLYDGLGFIKTNELMLIDYL